MDSFELNKIAGAILGSLLFVMGLGFVADSIYHGEVPETPGFIVEVPEEGGAEVASKEEAVTPFPILLASASAEDGEKVAKKCAACHTFDNGGGNKVGPNLWGIVGRAKGAIDGFRYSDTIAGLGASGEVWSYENLNGFLENPKDYSPGTSMAFAGLRKPEDRANIVAYLRSLNSNPLPLPEVEGLSDAQTPADDASAAINEAPAVETPEATDDSSAESGTGSQ